MAEVDREEYEKLESRLATAFEEVAYWYSRYLAVASELCESDRTRWIQMVARDGAPGAADYISRSEQ